MATRPRDSSSNANSNSRNKENTPFSSTNGNARSFRPSLARSPDKQEFCTDSYLADNASQSSLIPSPRKSTATLSKPRRSIHTIKSRPDDHRSRHRQTRSELPAARPERVTSHHSRPLTRDTSPVRSRGLSTPPRSPEGSSLRSPIEVLSSPPRALTETYERIDQEEDLAATEGEVSDGEDDIVDAENAQTLESYAPSTQSPVKYSRKMPPSPGNTPTKERLQRSALWQGDGNITRASVTSDPTGASGLSFFKQMSDQNLAAVLTPHALQSAEDRAALRNAWGSRRVRAFGKAGQVAMNGDHAIDSASSSPIMPASRLVAFSKAGKVKLASELPLRPHHQRTFSDVTEHIDPSKISQRDLVHNDIWHNDNIRLQAMPHNPRVHKEPYFPRNHGFPERNNVNGIGVEMAATNDAINPFRKARSESPFATKFQTVTASAEQREPEADISDGSQPRTLASPQPDWAQAAADRPVKSVEHEHESASQDHTTNTHAWEPSPEKSRKLDIDFTGTSFQVSESPPVRAKSSAQDFVRQREIRGLARQAVTTNRLNQLRARESQEKLRQESRSPASELSDAEQPLVDTDGIGEKVPNTPVVIYRSSSIGSNGKERSSSSRRQSADRSRSFDVLQRLARGSSTPRSSTPSEQTVKENLVRDEVVPEQQPKATFDSSSASKDQPNLDISRPVKLDAVAATPKVTGAWTDTILPDTIKTTKRITQPSRHAQTPHVSAGGWLDTPAPSSQPQRLEPVLEATQEVPEELMNGIVKDSASEQTIIPESAETRHVAPIPPAAKSSLAKRVLEDAKGRLEAATPSTPAPDDSLNLGNDTIKSLEHVLDNDETIISQLGEQSDTQVLDRLGLKLDRLVKGIHDTRAGITKLEQRVSEQPEASSAGELRSPEQVASRIRTEAPKSTFLPLALLTFTIPIPVLYRRRPGQTLPKPTFLGWLLLSFWTWYILECTLAELYCHPTFAEHYTWPAQREPEFPFVLPTMLGRWTRLDFLYAYLVQPVRRVFMALFRAVSVVLGVTDRFVDDPAFTATSGMLEEVRHGYGRAIDIDMMNDELV